MCKTGWQPNQVSQGGNMGQTRYLYLTNGAENARWFANEKGCDFVLVVRDVPASFLRVDPEDGMADSVEEELGHPRLPGNVVLTRPLGPEHFSLYHG
jgi:hypothetical protein